MKAKTVAALFGALALCTIAGTAAAKPPLELNTGGATKLDPIRYAPYKVVDGKYILTGDWRYPSGSGGAEQTWQPAFDLFEADVDGVPCCFFENGCTSNSTIPGAGPTSRWWFGAEFLNPFATNSMIVGGGHGGKKSERIEFAWGWGPLVPTQCFVAVSTFEKFGDCVLPDAEGFLTGYIFDFGIQIGGAGYFYTNIDDLALTGDFFLLPTGTGAYDVILADFLDPITGELTLQMTPGSQPMLWGAGADENPPDGRIGTQLPNQWDDDDPTDGIHTLNECYDYSGLGVCPDPLGAMILFYVDEEGPGCYPDCDLNSVLNIDDFICFQLKFALQDPYADCDGNSQFNIDDFICFQLAFALQTGC